MAFVLRCVLALVLTFAAAEAASAKSSKRVRSAAAQGTADMSCVPSSLQSVLAEAEQKFGQVNILSTHRPGAVVKGTGHPSLHRQCRAVDFRPTGNRRAIIAFLRQDPRVQGLGLYRDGHIHIDNGPARVTWNN